MFILHMEIYRYVHYYLQVLTLSQVRDFKSGALRGILFRWYTVKAWVAALGLTALAGSSPA